MMHKSVLLMEAIDALDLKENGVYVDATLGYGGHSSLILKKIKRGYLFAFDQDEDAINYAKKRLSDIDNNFYIFKSNFVNMKEKLASKDITKVDGILFDLGVSSPQLDEASRGFSYQKDARLDMRMDKDNDLSAYEVVNEYSYEKLVRIFYLYGEEKYAKNIASNIVKRRENKKIETTLELVDIIKASIPMKAQRDKHPAKKVFQAIRIEVNHELEVLSKVLDDAIELLNVGGVLAVITFHSKEDEIVKDVFDRYAKIDEKLSGLPYIPEEYLPKYKVGKKIKPTTSELEENNRAHSAILRTITRIRE